MRIWKQLLLSVVVLFVGLCLWIFVSPDAAKNIVAMGAPKKLVALIQPAVNSDAKTADAVGGVRSGSSGGGQGGNSRATLVAVRPVISAMINDRLTAIGSGEAIQSVVVMPQATGTLDEILVTAGQKVTKGQVLARLDDDEQLIERDKAQVALKSAVEKSSSYKNLQSVTRLDALDAQIAEEAAKLALSTAMLNLKRREIVAPIDGVAGIVAANVGDNVTTQTSIVKLDDRSEILVDFYAPERFMTQVEKGAPFEAVSVSRPGQVFKGVIESVDNRIDAASRTLRIRGKLENPADILRAGMSFQVTMRFAGESFPAVDPLAVQWDAEGAYVWKVANDKAQKVRVAVIQRNPDSVLVQAELKPDDRIVTEGLQRVREGQPVRIQGEPQRVAEAVTR